MTSKSSKPIEQYYLHDHGEGNGWQVKSRGPGAWGVVTTSKVREADGVIELCLDRYYTGGLSTTNSESFMISPEEALELIDQLKTAAGDAEDTAFHNRRMQDAS
tara:strand:+ start:90 stop:401 length:312 start_codon:yes stop_codon:yes gene_type:complete